MTYETSAVMGRAQSLHGGLSKAHEDCDIPQPLTTAESLLADSQVVGEMAGQSLSRLHSLLTKLRGSAPMKGAASSGEKSLTTSKPGLLTEIGQTVLRSRQCMEDIHSALAELETLL